MNFHFYRSQTVSNLHVIFSLKHEHLNSRLSILLVKCNVCSRIFIRHNFWVRCTFAKKQSNKIKKIQKPLILIWSKCYTYILAASKYEHWSFLYTRGLPGIADFLRIGGMTIPNCIRWITLQIPKTTGKRMTDANLMYLSCYTFVVVVFLFG